MRRARGGAHPLRRSVHSTVARVAALAAHTANPYGEVNRRSLDLRAGSRIRLQHALPKARSGWTTNFARATAIDSVRARHQIFIGSLPHVADLARAVQAVFLPARRAIRTWQAAVLGAGAPPCLSLPARREQRTQGWSRTWNPGLEQSSDSPRRSIQRGLQFPRVCRRMPRPRPCGSQQRPRRHLLRARS